MKKLILITLSIGSTASFFISSSFAQTPTVSSIKQEVKAVRESMKGKIVRLTKATVTEKNTTALTVTSEGKAYVVNISGSTKLLRHYFGKAQLSEINVGDEVNVLGTYANDNLTSINARQIRDISIMKRRGVFFGSISEISENTITLDSAERGIQTVTVSASTTYINQKGTSISISSLKKGDRIRVRGMWDKAKSTITEVTGIKDFSLK